MSAEIGPSFVIGQKIGAERGLVRVYGGSGCTGSRSAGGSLWEGSTCFQIGTDSYNT